MLAARRTYIDFATKLLAPEEIPYDFRDIQAHASYAFNNGVRLAITAYAGHDAFEFINNPKSTNPDSETFG